MNANFGQMQIVLAVHKRFGSAVSWRDGNDRRHVLEVGVVFYFYLAHATVSVPDFENHRQLCGHRL